MAEDVAVSRAIEKFGEERVKWVLALADSKTKWASQQNLPNEPQNISSASITAHLDGLIKEYKEYVQMQAADIAWQTGQVHTLSFRDRMAVATKKSDEQNRTPSMPKKKSKGMDR